MLGNQMLDFRKYLDEHGIIFCYSGFMTEDTLVGIGDAIKKKLALDETDRQTTRVVFSVFVEQVQNVIRYSAERQTKEEAPVVETEAEEIRSGIIALGREDDHIFITCGNMVCSDDVPRLSENLRAIQQMDKKELKALWKKTLRDGRPEGSKGAGVGFVDIARRARGGFDFEFTEVNDREHFFTIKAHV